MELNWKEFNTYTNGNNGTSTNNGEIFTKSYKPNSPDLTHLHFSFEDNLNDLGQLSPPTTPYSLETNQFDLSINRMDSQIKSKEEFEIPIGGINHIMMPPSFDRNSLPRDDIDINKNINENDNKRRLSLQLPMHYSEDDSASKRQKRLDSIEGVFYCDYPGCSYIATKRNTLSAHKSRKHRPDTSFPCRICGHLFHLSDSRNKHEKRNHGHELEQMQQGRTYSVPNIINNQRPRASHDFTNEANMSLYTSPANTGSRRHSMPCYPSYLVPPKSSLQSSVPQLPSTSYQASGYQASPTYQSSGYSAYQASPTYEPSSPYQASPLYQSNYQSASNPNLSQSSNTRQLIYSLQNSTQYTAQEAAAAQLYLRMLSKHLSAEIFSQENFFSTFMYTIGDTGEMVVIKSKPKYQSEICIY